MRKSIYTELCILTVCAMLTAVLLAVGNYYVCRQFGWLVQEEENYIVARKNCDIRMMELKRSIEQSIKEQKEQIEAYFQEHWVEIGIEQNYLKPEATQKEKDELYNNWLNFLMNTYVRENLTEWWHDKALQDIPDDGKMEIYIVDSNDQIKWKRVHSERNEEEEKEEIVQIIRNTDDNEQDGIYTFTFIETISYYSEYVVIKIPLEPEIVYHYTGCVIASMIIGFLTFIMILLLGIRYKIQYIHYLAQIVNEIAKGRLDNQVAIQGKDELALVAQNIQDMQENLNEKIEKEWENAKKTKALLTNVSHDLKTPITIIMGYLDIALKEQQMEIRQQYIEKSYDRALRMGEMIKRLLELTREEHLNEELHLAEVNLSRLVRQFALEYQIVVEEQQKTLFWDIQKDICLEADVEQITTVLQNLLENALKYSAANTQIEVKLYEEREGGTILLQVLNRAPEMKQQELTDIFEQFYRGDKARNSQVEGNGLGLSIVKKIVEKHNGRVWAEYQNGIFGIFVRLRNRGGNNGSNISG